MSATLRLWSVEMSENPIHVEELGQRREVQVEGNLEDTLVANPDMLEAGLRLVGRQTHTAGGWLDLLGVDADGRLVIFELKRGQLGREALTQVIDYASALNAMSLSDLSMHIAGRSGHDGIERINDFEDWYSVEYQTADLGQMLPPRMVLVGLGVNEAAERMVKFLHSAQVDIAAVTFHAFEHEGKTLLARQVEIGGDAPPPPDRGRKPIQQRREELEDYLRKCGLANLFEAVRKDLRAWISASVFEDARSYGVSFQLDELGSTGVRGPRGYFGVYAGYTRSGIVDISILPWALKRGDAALAELGEAVELRAWTHGGQAFSIESEEDWERCRPAMEAFVAAVMTNRDQYPQVAESSA